MWDLIRSDFRRHGFGHGASWALLLYRFGRWSLLRRPGVVRWVTMKLYAALRPLVSKVSGVYLERETQIGRDLHIVHAGMLHIHPDVVIGDRVGLMHGVTLGTNMGTGSPVIGDDVFVGCNASVLGAVHIGNGARVAANSLVMMDVPAGAVAIGVPARIVRELGSLAARAAPAKATDVPANAAASVATSAAASVAVGVAANAAASVAATGPIDTRGRSHRLG